MFFQLLAPPGAVKNFLENEKNPNEKTLKIQTLGDLTFYVVGGLDENEVLLSTVLSAFYESVSLLLR